jgi:DnaJ-class molecular chaperone
MSFIDLKFCYPEWGISRTLSLATVRKSTPCLHITRPVPKTGESDIYGAISITLDEAARGARKLTTIPLEYQKKPIILHIPAETRDGTKLRLAGRGKKIDDNHRGDFYLTVRVTNN